MTKLELWVWVCARLQRDDVRGNHSSSFLTQHSCHPLNLTNLIIMASSRNLVFRDTGPFSKEKLKSPLLSILLLGLYFFFIFLSERGICSAMMAWKSLSLRIIAIVMAMSVCGATPVEGEQASSQGSAFHFAISFLTWSYQNTLTQVRTKRRLGVRRMRKQTKKRLKPGGIWFVLYRSTAT